MGRPANQRVKVNPAIGRMPVLQFMPPDELGIDASYQRSIESTDSQTLIRAIATSWNWDLCQPLVVARRRTDAGDRLFVIDGQHRLAAATMRGDIGQLPCVIVESAGAADEAASFVSINQRRRPLSKIDVFKAAVASEDPESLAIVAALTAQGLSVAPHSNPLFWKPGMVANIGGLQASRRKHGGAVTEGAMRAMAQGFAGQVLQYAGTLFPGIAAVCAAEVRDHGSFGGQRFEKFLTMLGLRSQEQWRSAVLQTRVDRPGLSSIASCEATLRAVWATSSGDVAAPTIEVRKITTSVFPPAARASKADPFASGKAWCEQCEEQVKRAEAMTCKNRFCKVRGLA